MVQPGFESVLADLGAKAYPYNFPVKRRLNLGRMLARNSRNLGSSPGKSKSVSFKVLVRVQGSAQLLVSAIALLPTEF